MLYSAELIAATLTGIKPKFRCNASFRSCPDHICCCYCEYHLVSDEKRYLCSHKDVIEEIKGGRHPLPIMTIKGVDYYDANCKQEPDVIEEDIRTFTILHCVS